VEENGQRYLLQRLNPIFSSAINFDIQAITAELQAAAMVTPRLLPTAEEELSLVDAQGGVWRMMTFIEGSTLEKADSPARCHSAGRLLGQFHQALWNCSYTPRHHRLGVHDLQKHLTHLQEMLQRRRDHRLYAQLQPLAREILHRASAAAFSSNFPSRWVHGDPKITNIIFDGEGEALCLIDLDTVARMPLAVELGDALRSWCSPQGEDCPGSLEMDFFRAAMEGYVEGMGQLPLKEERQAIAAMVELIALELAARFAADTLAESYFGWDSSSFASAGEHHLARTLAQLSLARSAANYRREMEQFIEKIWPLKR
jgi:Ser/Thr protein kinase RdoA (MazF antagonist)